MTAVAIHGNRSQGQRERALADFIRGRVTTLVATDVAARGIHVDNVGVVVHFDPPATDKDYVHRSGRTGRAGADGLVVTLVAPDKQRDVNGLQRALALPQRVDAIALEHLAAGSTEAGRSRAVPVRSAPSRGAGRPRLTGRRRVAGRAPPRRVRATPGAAASGRRAAPDRRTDSGRHGRTGRPARAAGM